MTEINHNRFLTRVWDTEEKRMIYPEDVFSFSASTCNVDGYFIDRSIEYTFIGVNKFGLLLLHENWECATVLTEIPFGTRFIPMQCLGARDKNNKLIWQFDIITVNETYAKIYGQDIKNCLVGIKNGCAMYCRSKLCQQLSDFDSYLWMLINNNNAECEIIGNRFEQPELLEENDNESK